MLMFADGEYRELTQEEIEALGLSETNSNSAIDETSVMKEFATNLSNANTLADVRRAAQQFLDSTNAE